ARVARLCPGRLRAGPMGLSSPRRRRTDRPLCRRRGGSRDGGDCHRPCLARVARDRPCRLGGGRAGGPHALPGPDRRRFGRAVRAGGDRGHPSAVPAGAMRVSALRAGLMAVILLGAPATAAAHAEATATPSAAPVLALLVVGIG